MTGIDSMYKNSRIDKSTDAINLRNKILDLVEQYYELSHLKEKFEPGEDNIPYSGRVYNENELKSLVSSSLDFSNNAKWISCVDFHIRNRPPPSKIRSRPETL